MNSLKHPKKQNDNSKPSQMKKIKQFDFLMHSLDRQKFATLLKENNKNSDMKYSIKGHPALGQKWHMTNSTMVSPSLQTNQHKEMDVSPLVQTLIYKIKKYLSITESILQNPSVVEEKVKKQGINIAFQLIELVSQIQLDDSTFKQLKQQSPYNSLNTTLNLITGVSKSLSSSFCSPNSLASSFNVSDQSNTFIKKIQNLEEQKMYLESLISHHERANIKMFIKLNEGQSQLIEQYKKQLSSLFEKYKQLQKLVKRQSQRSKLLQAKLNQSLLVVGCTKQCEITTNQLTIKITSLQQLINEQNDSLSFAVEQIEVLKHKLQKYENQNISPVVRMEQPRKSQKNKQQSRVSQFPGADLIKSVLSQTGIQSVHNKSFVRNTSTNNIDSQPYFSNISIKSNSQTKIDENFMRAIVAQASALQSVLKI